MSKLFNRKTCATVEYTEDMLPHNRREVFFDVVKLHWKNLLCYGLLLLLFSLPLHVVCVFERILVGQLTLTGQTATNEQAVEISKQIISLKNMFSLIKVPTFCILAVGLSGIMTLIRNFAWGENVFFGPHFKEGVTKNSAQMILVALIFGVVNWLSTYAFDVAHVTSDRVTAILYMVAVGISVLLGIPMVAYSIVLIPIYKMKFIGLLKTSLLLVAKSPFKTLLALLCCLAIFLLNLIPNLIAILIVRFISTLISPFIMLGWFCFSLDRMDEHINKRQFPQLVGKGTVLTPAVELLPEGDKQ